MYGHHFGCITKLTSKNSTPFTVPFPLTEVQTSVGRFFEFLTNCHRFQCFEELKIKEPPVPVFLKIFKAKKLASFDFFFNFGPP
jgi:hypothetical protein